MKIKKLLIVIGVFLIAFSSIIIYLPKKVGAYDFGNITLNYYGFKLEIDSTYDYSEFELNIFGSNFSNILFVGTDNYSFAELFSYVSDNEVDISLYDAYYNLIYHNSFNNSMLSNVFLISSYNYNIDFSNNQLLSYIGPFYITQNTSSGSSSGYTQEQYNQYGQQQYTAGQQSVISSPNTYNLYSYSDYITYGGSQFQSGQNSILNSPNYHNLYTSQQLTDNYNAGYNAGVLYIMNHASNYNLYTENQYNTYGTTRYNAGYNAGYNAQVITTSAYSTGYNAGVSYVQNNPNTYNLYTSSQLIANGEAKYAEGVEDSDYSPFKDLISSVFDVPMNYIFGDVVTDEDTGEKVRDGGLFDFELFGYDVKGILAAALVCAILIKAIALVLAHV